MRKEAMPRSSQEDTIDPVLGQESGRCQPLIQITINQETIEQLSPKIEWWAVNRVSCDCDRSHSWPLERMVFSKRLGHEVDMNSAVKCRDIFQKGVRRFTPLDLWPAKDYWYVSFLGGSKSTMAPQIPELTQHLNSLLSYYCGTLGESRTL